jgi:hypothetical protein
MKWFVSPKFDRPEFNSPQPCIHGAGCVYTVKDTEGNVKPGCCRYVHPGEEGNGRRLFPETILVKDGKKVHMPACVRLTGKAGFYERRRLHLSWEEWCSRNNIPYTPNKAGEPREPATTVMRPTPLVPLNSLTRIAVALVTRIASSALSDADKDLCNEDIENAFEAIRVVTGRIERAAGVPVPDEEARGEALYQMLKATLTPESLMPYMPAA